MTSVISTLLGSPGPASQMDWLDAIEHVAEVPEEGETPVELAERLLLESGISSAEPPDGSSEDELPLPN